VGKEIKCELRFDMILKVRKADNSSVECFSADTKSCPVTSNSIAVSKCFLQKDCFSST
jgi:hypothetical protein